MTTFSPLALELSDWFDAKLEELPQNLQKRTREYFVFGDWNELTKAQRIHITLQKDYQRDPSKEGIRTYWLNYYAKLHATQKEINEWEAISPVTISERTKKEEHLAKLNKELSLLFRIKELLNTEPNTPEIEINDNSRTCQDLPDTYIAYTKAIKQLRARLNTSPEEVAIWLFLDQGRNDGLCAYLNANEMSSPERFYFRPDCLNDNPEGFDYVSPLMSTWFKQHDIDCYEPEERFITGARLIERWSAFPDIHVKAYICAKIRESRLQDLHPFYGGTEATFPEWEGFPPLESGLFSLTEIENIETAELIDFGSATQEQQLPEVGSPEWRSENARNAAIARHSQPGGSHDKQNQIRELWSTGKFRSRDECVRKNHEALGMSFTSARKALINTPPPSGKTSPLLSKGELLLSRGDSHQDVVT